MILIRPQENFGSVIYETDEEVADYALQNIRSMSVPDWVKIDEAETIDAFVKKFMVNIAYIHENGKTYTGMVHKYISGDYK